MKSLPPHRCAAMVALGLTLGLGLVPGVAARALPLEKDSSPVAVLRGRARTSEQRGRLDLAREDWLEVLALAPSDAEALAGLARAARAESRSAEAAQYLARLRAAHPDDPELARMQGKSDPAAVSDLAEAVRRGQAGDAQGALAIYRRVYGATPPPGNPAVAYYDAEGATAEGRPEAIAGLRALRDRFPDDHRYAIALGKLLLTSPRTRAEGRTLLERFPGDSGAVAALATAPKGEERAAAAGATGAKPLAIAVSPGERPSFAADRASADDADRPPAPRSPRTAAARTVAAQGGSGRHQEFAADEQAAFAALNQHRAAEAEQIFRGILAKEATNPRALAGLGYLRASTGDLKSAVNYFEQAQENGDRSLALTRALVNAQFAYVLQGADAATMRGDLPGAEAQYTAALRERPSDPEALDGLGAVLVRSGQPEKAIPVYTRLTRVRPLSPAAWVGLVKAETGAGRPAEALAADAKAPGEVKDPLAKDAGYQQALATARGQGASLVARAEPPPPPRVARAVAVSPPSAAATFSSFPSASASPAPSAAVPSSAPSPEVPAGGTGSGGSPAAVLPTGQAPGGEAPGGGATRGSASNTAAGSAPRSRPRQRGNGSVGGAAITAPAPPPLRELRGSPPLSQPGPTVEAARHVVEEAVAKERTEQGEDALRSGDAARAADLFREAVVRQPQHGDAWKGLVAALHAGGRDAEAVTALGAVPAAARTTLERDATLQQTAGAVFLKADRPGEALQSWVRAQDIFAAQRLPPPLDLVLNVARLLAARGADAELYRQLMYLGGRKDLLDAQRREIQMIWTRWAVRRARALAAEGEQPRAVVVLNAAAEAFAGNREVVSAVADGYAGVGLPREAVALYKAQDPSRDSAAALATAIRAAVAARDYKTAETWVRAGRERFPNDPGVLTAAAEVEQARGHQQRAVDLSRQARANAPAQDAGQVLTAELRESPGRPGLAAGGQLAALLLPDETTGRSEAGQGARPFLPEDANVQGGTGAMAPAPVLAGFDGSSR